MHLRKCGYIGCVLFLGMAACANEVKIVDAKAIKTEETWKIAVTLNHADIDMKHYADLWQVVTKEGDVLGIRKLGHPHKDQPFTRSLDGIKIPENVSEVYIEAHDKVHGWAKERFELVLERGLQGDDSAPAAEESLLKVEVKKDLIYGQVEGKDLLADAYLPRAAGEKPLPAVVVIHGGGFKSGSKEKPKFPEVAHYLAERGFACFAINYRLMDEEKFDSLLQGGEKDRMKAVARENACADTAAAIGWLRASHVEFGIDPDRIATLGGSAGAVCAFSAAFLEKPAKVVVLLWGTDEQLQERITADTPPIAIIVGTKDNGFERAQILRSICVEKGVPHIFKPLEGAKHAPWQDLEATENTKRWSFEFLKEYLCPVD